MKITFLPLLTLLFIGLKLGEVIAWSWFWVLFPIIFQLAMGFLIVALFIGIALFAEAKPKTALSIRLNEISRRRKY